MDGETRTKRRKMEEEEEKRGKKEDRYEFQRLSDHSDLYVCSTIDCILSIMFNATLYSTDIGRLRLLSARGGLFSFLFFFPLLLFLFLLAPSFYDRFLKERNIPFVPSRILLTLDPPWDGRKRKKRKKKNLFNFRSILKMRKISKILSNSSRNYPVEITLLH